jgi:ketopantoate hydroxymethyltransferase
MGAAFEAYLAEVVAGDFPGEEHSLAMEPDELASLQADLGE